MPIKANKDVYRKEEGEWWKNVPETFVNDMMICFLEISQAHQALLSLTPTSPPLQCTHKLKL
jgi:hypothetical protein